MQLLDGREPRQTDRLANNDDQKRDRGQDGERQPKKTECLIAREQILDQATTPSRWRAGQARQRAPEQRAPAEAASPPVRRIVNGNDRRPVSGSVITCTARLAASSLARPTTT